MATIAERAFAGRGRPRRRSETTTARTRRRAVAGLGGCQRHAGDFRHGDGVRGLPFVELAGAAGIVPDGTGLELAESPHAEPGRPDHVSRAVQSHFVHRALWHDHAALTKRQSADNSAATVACRVDRDFRPGVPGASPQVSERYNLAEPR